KGGVEIGELVHAHDCASEGHTASRVCCTCEAEAASAQALARLNAVWLKVRGDLASLAAKGKRGRVRAEKSSPTKSTLGVSTPHATATFSAACHLSKVIGFAPEFQSMLRRSITTASDFSRHDNVLFTSAFAIRRLAHRSKT
ncbi:MAG TPA: hypothetical protein PLK42_12215, partial [Casimicrobium sp.]|nr:hypothetical protein [Casimicrobium sp.]